MQKTSIKQKTITVYNLVSRRITDTSDKWVPTAINFLLKKTARKNIINPLFLFTENRKDIDYRISFLKDVLIRKINPKKTKYYTFILGLGPSYNPDLICKRFIEIYHNIKKNGMKKPVYIIKDNNKTVKARYFYKGQKYWKEYKNKTRYQIFDGAHRVAIAVFLGYKKVPCKIFKPVGFEIPDYTGYIKKREGVYNALINNPKLLELHKSLNKSLNRYSEQFGRGSFYQGFEKIYITGQRPTEERFIVYGLKKYLKRNQKVLDIGSNCGFFSLHVSRFVDSVDGIELDQNLINIANEVKSFLKIKNCDFYRFDFRKLKNKRYDIILSLAIHFWIGMGLKNYLERIGQMLNKGGMLLLESHDIENEDNDFDKQVKHIIKGRFLIKKEGVINDDNIVKREFMLLKKV